jgi:hypothetical protein
MSGMLDLTLTDPVGYFCTGKGTIEVLLGNRPAYYQLALDGEEFDAMFAVLVTAWRGGKSVKATLRGTEIIALEPA